MANVLKKFFISFVDNPSIWFFYAFLATSTLSIRKVLYYYPINEVFNEYTGIYIYLSDIFLFITIILWLFSLCNKFNILSIYKLPYLIKMFHVEHFSSIKKFYQLVIHNFLFFFPLFLCIFSFSSVLWSASPVLAFFRSVKILEFVLMYFFIIQIVPRGTICITHPDIKNCSTWNNLKTTLLIFICSGFIQSIVGIIQFTIQHSIGLTWLEESIVSPQLPGVAKIIFNEQSFIRAYGLFPHPNILGGFLVLSVISTIAYLKMFHVEHLNTKLIVSSKCSTWNIFANLETNGPAYCLNRTFFIHVIILIQGLALLLTFSKSAILGLFIGLFYLCISKFLASDLHLTLNCSTWNNLLFSIKKRFGKKILLLFGITILLVFIVLKSDTNSLFLKSLQEREFYLNVSSGLFLTNPLFGIGTGQFVPNMTIMTDIPTWQFQPVHNVFLLILNEFGIFMLFAFFFFLYKMFHVEHFANRSILITYFKAILLSFTFIMLFDHYLWDIQQGQIMLWVVLAILANSKNSQAFS